MDNKQKSLEIQKTESTVIKLPYKVLLQCLTEKYEQALQDIGVKKRAEEKANREKLVSSDNVYLAIKSLYEAPTLTENQRLFLGDTLELAKVKLCPRTEFFDSYLTWTEKQALHSKLVEYCLLADLSVDPAIYCRPERLTKLLMEEIIV